MRRILLIGIVVFVVIVSGIASYFGFQPAQQVIGPITSSVRTETPPETGAITTPAVESTTSSATRTSSTGELKVYLMDLGGGDAILLVMPNTKTMLLDGGERSDGAKVINFLRNHEVQRLDVVVATHPHSDHIGGLIDILGTISVDTVIDSGQTTTTKTYRDYLNVINQRNVPVKIGRAGQTIDLDSAVKIEILSPHEPLFTGDEALSANSIVVKATHGDIDFLFPADAEPVTEQFLSTKNIDVEVLVASHHGSGESNTEQFLKATTPETVVVIYSRLISGLDSTLERISRMGAQIYRTDLQGTITITSTGSSYKIEQSESLTAANTITGPPFIFWAISEIAIYPSISAILALIKVQAVTTH